MIGTGAGLLLSLIGLFVDKRKGPARMGLIITGAILVIFVLVPVVSACFR